MTPFEKLELLYASIPEVHCQKKCQRFCGPVIVSKIELSRLEKKRGYLRLEPSWVAAKRLYLPSPAVMERECVGVLPDYPDVSLECSFLSALGKCTAYDIRPMVCRIWGAVKSNLMQCPFGCVPDRWLTDEEVMKLYYDVFAIQKEWQQEGQ